MPPQRTALAQSSCCPPPSGVSWCAAWLQEAPPCCAASPLSTSLSLTHTHAHVRTRTHTDAHSHTHTCAHAAHAAHTRHTRHTHTHVPPSQLVCCLAASGAAMLCPEFAHVSMRLVREIPKACELAARVVTMVDRLGLDKVCGRFEFKSACDPALQSVRFARIGSLACLCTTFHSFMI